LLALTASGAASIVAGGGVAVTVDSMLGVLLGSSIVVAGGAQWLLVVRGARPISDELGAHSLQRAAG
jgi:hypothetical protein